jgi:DNA-directed RNA polymerase sigma subunit (sigma70/sigma32)
MSAEQISTLPGGELQDFLQYIREIQEYPLLSQQQEIDLAMSIESGVEAMQTMVAANDLSEFSVEDLAFRIRAGEEARTTFINSNLRLVIAYAKKIHSNTMNLQDKIQEGNIIHTFPVVSATRVPLGRGFGGTVGSSHMQLY